MRFLPTVFVLLSSFLISTLATAQGGVEDFAADTRVATSGFYRLTWNVDQGVAVELQEATTADFEDAVRIYEGTDQACFVSGKVDGEYFYRIRVAARDPNGWVGPVVLTVSHHPLSRAGLVFGLGAFIFASTLLLVFRRPRRQP